jgi:hypothetical protein
VAVEVNEAQILQQTNNFVKAFSEKDADLMMSPLFPGNGIV